MKKYMLLWLALMLFLLACQPTPDEPVVIGKADGKLEERIESTPMTVYEIIDGTIEPAPTDALPQGLAPTENASMAEPTDAPQNTLRSALGAPTHATDAAEGKVYGGTLKVTIDADVEVPNVSTVPVFTVQTRAFTVAEKERYVRVMLGDGPYYNLNRAKTEKAAMRRSIEQITKKLSDCDNRAYGEDFDYDQYRFAEERNLQSANKSYAAMPEPGQMEPWTGRFSDDRLQVANEENCFVGIRDGMVYRHDSYMNSATPFDMHAPRFAREQQAMDAAVAWFEQMTGESVTAIGVSADDDTFYARVLGRGDEDYGATQHTVGLIRLFAGIPLYPYRTYHGSDSAQELAGCEWDFDEPVYPEDLWVLVENGEVIAMQWDNVIEVTATENENVALLPFSDILEIFKKQIFRSIYIDPADKGYPETVWHMVVERVCLSYMKVKKPNGNGECYLLPVWDFMGYDYDPKLPPMTEAELASERAWFSGQSLLTINAIDGSIVDRNAGY